MAYCIEASRVRLRTVGKADADSIYRYGRYRDMPRYTLHPRPYQRENALELVKMSQRSARTKKPNMIVLGIEYKATGEIVGAISLHQIDYRHRNAEIGCWMGKPYQGRGLVTEAMQAYLQYAFTALKVKRVAALVDIDNIASQRLVKRCGFTREGCLRSNFLQRKRWRTSYLYSILREEFRADDKRVAGKR
jgi:[ribosomal protein S5]-alanine N-acetyltransferase